MDWWSDGGGLGAYRVYGRTHTQYFEDKSRFNWSRSWIGSELSKVLSMKVAATVPFLTLLI